MVINEFSRLPVAQQLLAAILILAVNGHPMLVEAQPTNDRFANRTDLAGANVTVQGNTTGASSEPGENVGGGAVLLLYSVWYEWTAPTGGVARVSASTTVPNFYLSIGVYRGLAVNALVAAPSTPSGGFPVAAGDTLVFQIASVYYPVWAGGGGSGPFTFHLTLEIPSPTSPNDAFANRLEITHPTFHFAGSIYGATQEPGEPLPAPTATQTLWWKFVPPDAGLLTLLPSAPNFSPILRVYEGDRLETLVQVAATSGLTYRLEAGREYAIQMASGDVAAGDFTLDTRFYSLSHDQFAGSLRMEGTNVIAHGNTLVATFEVNEPDPGATNTIWFSWVAPATGRTWFSPGPNVARAAAVYTGPTLERLVPVRLVSADNGVFCFLAEEGTVYHFQYAGQTGDFALSVQLEPLLPCTNDDYFAAQLLKGQNTQDRRSVLGATTELGEPVHGGPLPAKSIWWKWQAPVHGLITFWGARSLVPDLVLAVYQGTEVAALTLVALGTNWVTFSATGGETYSLAAAVPENALGDVLLYWQYNRTYNVSVPVPGNLLREPSWEGTGILGAQYWQMAGEIGGYVNEWGGADGTTWPVLGGGARIWQELATVPGHNHAIRFAFKAGGARIRVSWDNRELGVAQIPPEEGHFWHWAEFTAYASNTTSRLLFANLGPMFANVAVDAFSVVSLTDPPRIITSPQSITAFAGGAAAFLVGASGSAPLTYQWFLNDAPLSGQGNRLLLLDPVTAAQAGQYRVTVANAYGAVTSAPAALVVEAPTVPVIMLQPFGDTVPVGSYFNLSVVAMGTPPLQYHWHLNGQPIVGATNRNLAFSQIQATNAGIYQVRVKNWAGTTWSLPAAVVVTATNQGGGMIDFRNRFGVGLSNADAPIFDLDGVTPLNGDKFVAQLYAGPTLETLRPAGQPTPFRTGFNAGFFISQVVTLANVPPGGRAVLQVRAWERERGTSYEEARAFGGKFGKSEIVEVTAGGLHLPPQTLVGLSSFSLRAGLPHFFTGVITLLDRIPGGIIIWQLQGEPGFRYVVEKAVKSDDGIWRPYVVVTNVTGAVTFSDSANTGSRVVFYRTRILD